jgi:hypothetical protein
MPRSLPGLLLLALAAVLLSSCSPTGDAGGPTDPTDQEPEFARVGADCLPGCTDTDPNVNAPGYFMTSAVTGNACALTTSTDLDRDGLVDRCERDLAVAFAPELYYYNADEVGREPKWVARWLTKFSTVRIGYLLSYYRDAGNGSFGCDTFGWLDPSCGGHHGDSESIFLDVTYNTTTRHWVLTTAFYSAHESVLRYDGITGRKLTPYKLFYPDHPQGYPRAWVAQGKHANYSGKVECENGGTGGSDTCDRNNAAARVVAFGQYNLGSRATHTAAQDSTPSLNPAYQYYGQGRYEAYWTNKQFAGWVPNSVSGLRSSAYSPTLSSMGF